MPYASLTQKDTTASKIPSSHGGFGACLGGGGFGLFVTVPVALVGGVVTGITRLVKKKKAQRDIKKGKGELRNEKDIAAESDTSVSSMEGDQRTQEAPAATADHIRKLSSPPRNTGEEPNPRACNGQCAGIREGHCFIHDKDKPEQPPSPGLLAV